MINMILLLHSPTNNQHNCNS